MSVKEIKATEYTAVPRWSYEVPDCSMPLTFDTYDRCSYGCLYCFAVYQKAHQYGGDYAALKSKWVNVERIKRLFTESLAGTSTSPFATYIRERKTMQWGAMADQFDEHERETGITLELLKFFKSINYPLCFSTKASWFTRDERYMSLIRGQKNWNFKFSIINLNAARAEIVEPGVDTPEQRLDAIKRIAEADAGGATLRLRPFIIGHTNRDGEHLELIRRAAMLGATAMTTEFYCVDARMSHEEKWRYDVLSKMVGYDVMEFYKKHSVTSGYYRLNRKIKEPYLMEMKSLCDQFGMRFYVSDAHWKELSCNGSCCGLPESWNYSRGQFTEAIIIAREKGEVRWSDIEPHMNHLKFTRRDSALKCMHTAQRTAQRNHTIVDALRSFWNTPNSEKSPYKYFAGALLPTGTDEQGNVIYKYNSVKKESEGK